MRWHTGNGGGENGVYVEARTHILGEDTPRPPPSCAEVPSFRLIDIDSKMASGALTAYISAHSTSHPALRGTPFASPIHPLPPPPILTCSSTS